MSTPNDPPAGPEPSGASPEKRSPPDKPIVAIPTDRGAPPESVPTVWWRRQGTTPPGPGPAGSEPAPENPPQMTPTVRLTTRPPIEAAAAAPPVSRPPVAAPRSVLRSWMVRLLMIVICLGSAAMVYWSLFLRLQPVTREREKSFARMSRLSDEVEQLRRKWNPVEVEATKAQHRAVQRLLFTGPAELQEWEKEAARQSQSLMLESALEMGRGEIYPVAGLNLESVRADLSVRPAVPVGVTNSPYKQVLGFVQGVINSPKRVDLLELAVDGDSNSVAQARARVQFFALGSGTNTPAPAPTGGTKP